VVEARARYSASEEDLETVLCFFAFHEMKELPIKKQYLVMDHRESMQLPQSASLKPVSRISESRGKNNPCPGQPFR